MRRVGKFLVFIVFLSVLCSAKGALAAEYQCNSCSSCNDAITNAASSDTVRLNTSINNYAGGTCISFGGKDNITFDCMGNTIDGDSSGTDYGIWLNNSNSGSNNNTIKNCTVRNFALGIYSLISSYNTIANMTITENDGDGIQLMQSANNTITDVNSTENDGLDIIVLGWSADHCANYFSNIKVSGAYPFMYYNSSVNLSNQTLSELLLCNADNSRIDNVTIIGSTAYKNNGIFAELTDYSNFTNINSSFRENGIFVASSSNNLLINITANYNEYAGIGIQSGENNSIRNSTTYGNLIGIHLYVLSNYNIINGSRIANSTSEGVYLHSSGAIHPSYNNFYNNFLNNTLNVYSDNASNLNYWNTTRQNGSRVYSAGNEIGGNFWAYPNGTGYSQTCSDTNNDGFCDSSFALDVNNTDYLPLSGNYSDSILLSGCSVLNQSGRTYNLTQDISNSGSTVCMNITADNITLDCGAYKIDGSDSSNTYGIYMNGRKNVTIRNCTITDWWYGIYFSGTNSSFVWQGNVSYNTFGVYMTAGSVMNNISSTRISKNDRNGIEIASSSSYNSIRDSVIHENSHNGIYSSSSHWNNLTNVSLYSNTLSGMNLSSSQNYTIMLCNSSSNIVDGIYLLSSDRNRIENTTTAFNDYSGIYAQSSSRNNISGANASANDYYGICLISSSSNNVLFNTTTNNNQGSGIYIESSSINNTATKCTSFANTVYGIIVQLSPDNNFTECQINSNKDQGIRLYDCSNNYFMDSSVNGSTNNDVYASSPGASANYFINTTFNKTSASINSNALIWVKWYLYVKILSGDENPLESVNITIVNKYNISVFSGLSNATGDIARQILTEYNETSGGKNYYTNYTINASKTGFVDNQSYVNLTATRSEIIYLGAIGPPSVQVGIYTLGLVESDIVKPGRIVRIRALVTYSIGSSYLKNSTIDIRDNASSLVVNNQLMVNISEITNGYVYEYNYTIPDSARGIWLVDVTAASSTGAEGYGSKKMAIIPLSIKIKLVLNSTSDVIYIPGTGERAFSDLTTAEYTTPSHYYIASYSSNILKGMVLSSMNPISIVTEKDSSTYGMGTVQRLSNSMAFIVFSRGTWNEINNRISSIERGDFLLSSEPSFSFGLGKAYPFKVILEYQNIDINKTVKLGRGYNSIVVENLGKSGGKVNLIIKRA